MAILVNVGRYDTYAALPTGSKSVISGRENPGCKGEIVSTLAVSPTHTSSDISGSYSGGRYHWGRLISPCYETTARSDTSVPSWDAKTPAGTWLELELRVRCAGVWIGWFKMGVWASGTESVKRHSVGGQKAGIWQVLIDTLQSIGPVFADAYRYRLTLFTEEWALSRRCRVPCRRLGLRTSWEVPGGAGRRELVGS